MRIVVAFVIALCMSMELNAQSADSVLVCYDLGFQYMQERRYADAYSAFQYYMQNVSQDEKNTDKYEKARVRFYEAKNKVPVELSNCYEQAVLAQKKNQMAQADELFRQYVEKCVTPESQQTHEYTVALTQYAQYLKRMGKLDDAMNLLHRAAEVRRTTAYMNRSHVAETLNLMASIENQRGHYDEAIALCTEALGVYEKFLGKKHDHYGTTLSNLAGYYATRNAPGDRTRAVEMGEEAVQVLPKNSPAYAQAMNNLVLYYSLSGDMVKAQKYGKTALQTMKRMQKNTVYYASLLSNHAVRLANSGNYEQAVEYAREAIAIYEENDETQSLNFARLLSNAASFEKHGEHYEEAITLWQRAAPIYEKIEGKGSSGYMSCMSEISAAHSRKGNLEQAANINEQLQATVSEQVNRGAGDGRIAQSLVKQASTFAANGNYGQAMTLEQQALSIFRVRKDLVNEASCLKDISGYLYHMKRLDEAIDTCRLALNLYEKMDGHHEERALVLNSLSIYYYASGNYKEALTASCEAVKHYEMTDGTESSIFAKILTNQALYEARHDSLQTALNIYTRADSIQRRVLGETHPDNVTLMFNMANLYVRMGRKNDAHRLFHKALTLQMQNVRNNFSHLTTRGREMYWGTKNHIFRAAPAMACLMEDVDSARIDAYDSQLFTKGLLLNSEIDFRNLLSRTASADLQDKYERLVAIRMEVEQAYRNPTKETADQVKKLTADANRLERELVRGCKEFGDFTESMSIHYGQVVNALNRGDAAIEFFDLDTPEDGRTYWALLALHDSKAPIIVRLFSEADLYRLRFHGLPLTQALTKREGINAVFEDTQVGQFVWGRLIPYLTDVRNIWFAPSGLFYQWGIEYLKYDNRRIGDMYALHRVSSTKLLVQQERKNGEIGSAVVFGGLNYDATEAELKTAMQEMKNIEEETAKWLAMDDIDDWLFADTRTMEGFERAGMHEAKYLPGTRVEAEVITEQLAWHGVDTKKYTGSDGAEETFKSLSGKGTSIIHIATHGFTLSEDVVQSNRDAMSYLEVSGDETAQADNSLCYSGLLMAGANNALRGVKMSQGMENGVLTAREIAKLDLRGLDLAVLSACQTGLGELKEDGVFGLQRGFKKAGARTLLMSLWSVSDKATELMMTTFYSALADGQTRRQAFHTAQETVRNTEEFSAPVFWASFVMLDD